MIPYESRVFAKKFVKFKHILAIKLSNSIFQFFWGGDSISLRGYRYVKWKVNGE